MASRDVKAKQPLNICLLWGEKKGGIGAYFSRCLNNQVERRPSCNPGHCSEEVFGGIGVGSCRGCGDKEIIYGNVGCDDNPRLGCRVGPGALRHPRMLWECRMLGAHGAFGVYNVSGGYSPFHRHRIAEAMDENLVKPLGEEAEPKDHQPCAKDALHA